MTLLIVILVATAVLIITNFLVVWTPQNIRLRSAINIFILLALIVYCIFYIYNYKT